MRFAQTATVITFMCYSKRSCYRRYSWFSYVYIKVYTQTALFQKKKTALGSKVYK